MWVNRPRRSEGSVIRGGARAQCIADAFRIQLEESANRLCLAVPCPFEAVSRFFRVFCAETRGKPLGGDRPPISEVGGVIRQAPKDVGIHTALAIARLYSVALQQRRVVFWLRHVPDGIPDGRSVSANRRIAR